MKIACYYRMLVPADEALSTKSAGEFWTQGFFTFVSA
jgi:hypothetical protein